MSLKVLTILGTRPEFIRLSRIIPLLDRLSDQVIVHTGQNYDAALNQVFFDELGLRKPDHFLEARGSFGEQLATICSKMEQILEKEKPDRFLVLGDTNSSLAAIMAKRAGIPVYHMEAGNRCYDDRVPEEVNRRIIDHSSDVLLPYTERSRMNLLKEGIPGERIYVTGNPIFEVIEHFRSRIDASGVQDKLGVKAKGYVLVTIHRAENVDIPSRLAGMVDAFAAIQAEYKVPVIVSTHPRTRKRLEEFGLAEKARACTFVDPFGFFDFVNLELNALCVLSDSGTVQEECAIFGIPNVILRDSTERPEAVECGSMVLSGLSGARMIEATRMVLALERAWTPPPEYVVRDVSSKIAKIVLGAPPLTVAVRGALPERLS